MSKRKIIFFLLLIIIFSLIILLSYKIYNIYHDNKKIDNEINMIKEEVIVKDDEPKTIEDTNDDKEPVSDDSTYKLPLDFNKLKSINSDTVAWIKVNNTNIDYPIVKANDNVYYLDHSFYKDKNVNGWIFENSVNSSYFDDDNTTLFGHNTNGYTMFSELRDIYNGVLGTNINITIYLENDTINYKVFSVYLEKPNNTSNISKYLNVDMIKEMQSKSKLKIDANINENSKILTLSTCNNITSDRIILHAVKVS